jgi:hypothetical protein
MKNNAIVTILVAALVGGGGFYAGMKYQASKQQTGFFTQGGNFAGRSGGNGAGGARQGFTGRGGAAGMRPVSGEILSSDDKSMTVKLPDGSTKIVLFSDSTPINKAAAGTKTDLKTGERVAVFGTANSDGSVTAQNIQLNPQMRGNDGGSTPSATRP